MYSGKLETVDMFVIQATKALVAGLGGTLIPSRGRQITVRSRPAWVHTVRANR